MSSYIKILTLLIAFTPLVKAQVVENVVAEQKDNGIEITYDLAGSIKGQKFNVEVYCSIDNFKAPIHLYTGDAGAGIEEGKGKKIYWNISNELGAFKGDITFELQVTLIYTPIKFLYPKENQIVKRGVNNNVSWTGVQNSQYKLELLKSGISVVTLIDITNPNTNLLLPVSTPPGDEYALKVTDLKNDEFVSQKIKIRRKFPLALKIAIPVALIAGATTGVIIATQPKKTSDSNTSNSGGTLPGPPSNP
ncbi:MAG: hypothetical protein SFY32_14280 [Bacteroidota bacterium]|nr:hypothetical protein [Bacteroidota bacterium]